ncbi:MAG: AAA family ATPase [Clostridia bacterium]|nr:AAA family ATPase [Clostridia bacterium]
MSKITKIVITGGPCAGKTTAMSRIRNAFTQRGYRVLIVPETATELITGGITPWTCRTNVEYQKCQAELQLTKERLFGEAASGMDVEKILIICDRGMMDNGAYMKEDEFKEVLGALHGDVVHWRDGYDAVFHLVTAANGAQEFYTKANNTARYESVEEAIALDDRILASWTGHRYLRVIDNSTDFEEKMRRLEKEITAFLQEDHPYEFERKYLIAYPDISWLEGNPLCRKLEIEQVYLKSEPNEEIRIRKRGEDGHFIYYETHKIPIDENKRMTTERSLSKSEYRHLLKNADPSRHRINKTRYCLTYGHRYFVIDVYPFWKDQAVLGTELRDEKEAIGFPPEISVIREVTDDPAFTNASLALITSGQKSGKKKKGEKQ